MKFLKPFYTPLVLCLFFSSCSSVYMPNVPVASMLTKSGEFHGGAHINLKGNVNVNTAFAVSDHVGLIANGSIMDNNGRKKDFKQGMWEVGGGYFNTFGEGKRRILEIYGGYGRGNTDRIYKDLTYDGPVTKDIQKVEFDKIFVQVNYSAKNKKDLTLFDKKYPLNFGTILRISQVSMQKFSINDIEQNLEDNVFLEPVFFTRVNLSKNFQVQYSSGSNIGLIHRKYLKAGNSVFTLGVIFNVGGKN